MVKILRHPPHSFKIHFLRWNFWAVLAALVIMTHFAAKSDFIQRTGLIGLDAMQSLVREKPAEKTRIVKITRDTLNSYFGSMAPYHSPAMVMKAIDCIALHKPAIIAVDLFTDTPEYKNKEPKTNIPIVWAYEVDRTSGRPKLPQAKSINFQIGAAQIVGDQDIMLRHYSREVTESTTGATFDSFPWAIVQEYCKQNKEKCPDRVNTKKPSDMKENWILSRHSGLKDDDPTVFALEDLLPAYEDWNARNKDKNPAEASDFLPNSELKDKIVILGPYYGDDLACTPDGRWRGARVVANVIESELSEIGIREMPELMEWVFDILLALLIVLLHHYLLPKPACVALLALMTFSIFGTRLAYCWHGYWANFIFLILGIWIEQLYELSSVAERDALQSESAGAGKVAG